MKTQEIADFLSADLAGDPNIEIVGLAALDTAVTGEIAFSESQSFFETKASAVLVSLEFNESVTCTVIKAASPKLAFTLIAPLIHIKKIEPSWHANADIADGADVRASFIGPFVTIGTDTIVGDSSEIHSGVRIGRNVIVGERTVIHPNSVVYDGTRIGSDCIIHAGTVIGSDGFGYVKDENGSHHQFPQIGSVVIEDNVEIGANCSIDRGSLGTTRIGEGTKIDNLVHIAHNVHIGKRVIIAGQSGIAGSSVIEDDVVIAGQVGISDHVTIRSGAVIGAKSAVFPNKIVRSGVWAGIPVQPLEEYARQNAGLKGLQKLKDDIKDIKKLQK